jgi:hypothetical protein
MGNSTAWNLRGRLDGRDKLKDKQLFTFQEERGSLVRVCARVCSPPRIASNSFDETLDGTNDQICPEI